MIRKVAGAVALFLMAVLAAAQATTAAAVDSPAEAILKGIALKYSRLKTLSAEFIEETEHRAIGKRSVATGKVLFKRPNMFRWIMLNPPGDELISDGTTLWIYQPELAQVIKGSARGGIAALVTGIIGRLHALEEDFKVDYMGKASGLEVLRLKPRTERYATVEGLTLYIEPSDYSLRRIEIDQGMGRIITIRFSNMVINPILDDSLFRYSPPKGVTVVEP